MSERELRPVGRYEWEQIVLRARLSGLIAGNARGTRGGVSAATIKVVALVYATHAAPDGTQIFPGDATVAVEAEVSLRVVKTVKAKLLELGLLERVKAGARRLRRNDEYRLTLPTDLLEQVDVLTPAQLRLAATAEYERQHGKKGSAGPRTTTDIGGPADPVHGDGADVYRGSGGPANEVYRGSGGTVIGGPADPQTNHDQAISLPTHTQVNLRTAVTVSRAREAVGDPIPDDDQPSGCLIHGRAFSAGVRADGAPICPLCRVAARAAPPDSPTGQLAPVIPLRSVS